MLETKRADGKNGSPKSERRAGELSWNGKRDGQKRKEAAEAERKGRGLED